MRPHLSRRGFLAASAATGAQLLATGRLEAGQFRTTLHSALIGAPTEETLSSWKGVGFEGMETNVWNTPPRQAHEARKRAERLGMRIHSVLRGWTNLNSSNRGQVANDIASVETALKATQAYGADALLLVPCRVRGMAIPEAWEFDIEFDGDTGHVTRVVTGDNTAYRDYIEAQNHATDVTRAALKKLIAVAEKTGVVIAVENVWNNLWVKPDLFAHFVGSFKSPWVQAYFDIGNHVKYTMPEVWIRTLGKLIVRCHVKDFQLNPDRHGGRFVDIRDGSVNWPVVREALDGVGYTGWLTIEGSDSLSLAERKRRLALIIAGH